MRRAWYPSVQAVLVDGFFALGLFALELPAALVLDPDRSPAFHQLRLAVGVAAALAALLARRGFPLLLLAVAVLDAQLRHLGSYALYYGSYAVARWEPDERVALGAVGVAAVAAIYPQRWVDGEYTPIAYLLVALQFVLLPAAVAFGVRQWRIRRGIAPGAFG